MKKNRLQGIVCCRLKHNQFKRNLISHYSGSNSARNDGVCHFLMTADLQKYIASHTGNYVKNYV
jgi:hypothetical protein